MENKRVRQWSQDSTKLVSGKPGAIQGPQGPSGWVRLEPTSDWSRAGFSVWPLPPAPPGTELHIELWDGFEERALTLVYGDEIDATPPRPPPAPRLELEPYTVPEDTSCGDAHRGDRVYVRVPTEFDEDAVGYQVTFTTPASPDGFRAGLLTKLRHARLWLMSARTPATEVCATAQTIDRAGNWSTPSVQTCVYAGEGCAAAEGSLPTLGLLGAALGLLRRRRRARPTPRGQPLS